jgi:hypothetical protein
MATTRYSLHPCGAENPTTNFPQPLKSGTHFVLGFDATTEETCYWGGLAAWQGLSGALTAIVHYAMASATTGGVAFGVSIEALTPGDSTDTDAGDSFDTENTASDASVPGTAGYPDSVSVTLTNADSIAAGDQFRVRLARKVGDAADTASGDVYVFCVELREA